MSKKSALVKVTVHPDSKSKPQRANTKTAHMEYVAKIDPRSQHGEWRGKFVPKTANSAKAAQKAQQLLQRQNVPADPASYVGG